MLNVKLINRPFIAAASTLSFSIGFSTLNPSLLAQTQTAAGSRWYATATDVTNPTGSAAVRVTRKVVAPTVADGSAPTCGFVAHPLWLNTSSNTWVEVGYDRGPCEHGYSASFYWWSETSLGGSYGWPAQATVGSNYTFEIIWDANQKIWNLNAGGKTLAQRANIGGPPNVTTQSIATGLESTSSASNSPAESVWNIQHATLSNWTWRGWPSAAAQSDSPAVWNWGSSGSSSGTNQL